MWKRGGGVGFVLGESEYGCRLNFLPSTINLFAQGLKRMSYQSELVSNPTKHMSLSFAVSILIISPYFTVGLIQINQSSPPYHLYLHLLITQWVGSKWTWAQFSSSKPSKPVATTVWTEQPNSSVATRSRSAPPMPIVSAGYGRTTQ